MPARRKSPRRSKSRSKSPRRVLKRRSSGRARTNGRVTQRRSPKRTYKGGDTHGSKRLRFRGSPTGTNRDQQYRSTLQHNLTRFGFKDDVEKELREANFVSAILLIRNNLAKLFPYEIEPHWQLTRLLVLQMHYNTWGIGGIWLLLTGISAAISKLILDPVSTVISAPALVATDTREVAAMSLLIACASYMRKTENRTYLGNKEIVRELRETITKFQQMLTDLTTKEHDVNPVFFEIVEHILTKDEEQTFELRSQDNPRIGNILNDATFRELTGVVVTSSGGLNPKITIPERHGLDPTNLSEEQLQAYNDIERLGREGLSA